MWSAFAMITSAILALSVRGGAVDKPILPVLGSSPAVNEEGSEVIKAEDVFLPYQENKGEEFKGVVDLPLQSPRNTPDVVCPEQGSSNYVIHLPHPTDCTKFYKCDHGRPVLFNCPPKLHFNPKLQVCDWPDQAGCMVNKTTTPIPTTTTPMPTTTTPMPTTTTPMPTTTTPLPTTTTPMPTTTTPMPTTTTPMPTTTTPVPTTTTPTTTSSALSSTSTIPPPSSLPQPVPCRSKLNLPHESDCALFYHCIKGLRVLYRCPWGHSFDDETRRCRPGGCVVNQTTTPMPTTTTPMPTTTTPMPTTTTPMPTTTTPIPTTTTPTTTSSALSSTSTIPPPSSLPQPVRCRSKLNLPHECDCALFYHCIESRRVLYRCPWGQGFDDETRRCRPGGCMVNQTTTPIPTTTTPIPTTTTPTPTSSAPSSTSTIPQSSSLPKPVPCRSKLNLPHECDCGLFYHCIESRRILYRCPWGQSFDDETRRCRPGGCQK